MITSQSIIHCLTVGPFQENCYLLVQAGELAIFDPGDEPERLIAEIDKTGAKPRYILLTHAHLDHVGAARALQEKYDVPLCVPAGELELLGHLPLQCQLFGLPPIPQPRVDQVLKGDETLKLGDAEISQIPTPGHSPGGVSYRVGDHVFVGDTIFAGGVGRTDLWGGSWPTLEASIQQRIFTLPEAVTLYPGHGPTTTVGAEKRSNPFFN
jgi:glyoxylase-like metal-dependent hydrolase (beta-lactamase superfamily II)